MWANEYAALLGSTESYSECTQTRVFENHANLLAYLVNWPLFTPENGFQGAVECQGFALLKFSLCLLFENTARTGSY